MEQSGPAPGWHALGVQWMHPKGSVHGLWGGRGVISIAALIPIQFTTHTTLLFGWGIHMNRPTLCAEYQQEWSPSKGAHLRVRFSHWRDWESFAWLQQQTEWGWNVILASHRASTGEVDFYVGAAPGGHPHLKGMYVSTRGQWRVHWEGRFGRVFLGSGPYPYAFLGLYRPSPIY